MGSLRTRSREDQDEITDICSGCLPRSSTWFIFTAFQSRKRAAKAHAERSVAVS